MLHKLDTRFFGKVFHIANYLIIHGFLGFVAKAATYTNRTRTSLKTLT
jgi:hypothetical protein